MGEKVSSDSLNGRHVVVTGGTGSLGQAVVRLLLKEGAICSIPCFSEEERENAPFDETDMIFLGGPADLTDEEQTESFYAAAVENHGDLWASVHTAGGFGMGRIDSTSADDFTRQFRLNTLTCYNSCRSAVKQMRRSGGGRLVNVASRPALEPRQGDGMSAYTASKAAVAALTQSLAAELVDDHILVNAVAPSVIDTPQNRSSMPDADFESWPKPVEIAHQILSLISPLTTVTRGAVIPVYGTA